MKRLTVLLPLALAATATFSTVALVSNRTPSPHIAEDVDESVAYSALDTSSSKPRIETEVITLLPTGFNPSEITRPHKRFLVVVDNQSGLEEITLRLDRVAGRRVREVRRRREEMLWRQVEDLPPGEYLLNEANHPDWTCRITIKPR